ncbi:MAG TPA: CAP domain-containing protein [Pseudolysinimonas sp.]|nr:CAP domain-containing protein [Pseudolysinimonas sp.]
MSHDRQWRRARLHVVILSILAAVLTATLFFPQNAFAAPAVSPVAGPATASSVTVADMTRYVYDATNKVRFDKGLPGLARDARLDKVAMAWALQQYKNGKMSHNPDYAKQIPAGWARAGENVASGYTYTQVVPAWIASASHYANLVRDYTSIGIGFYESGGKRYWVQTFAKYPGTKQPAKPEPPARIVYPSEPAVPSGTSISLASASFEGGFGGWLASGARLDGPSTAAKGGRYALAIPGGRTVSQLSGIRPAQGATYTATIWVKPGGTSAVSGSLRLSATGGTTETATMAFSVSSGWMKVSVPLTVGRTGHSGLRIDVVLGSGDFRLDSASLVLTQAPAGTTTRIAPPAAPVRTTSPAPGRTR